MGEAVSEASKMVCGPGSHCLIRVQGQKVPWRLGLGRQQDRNLPNEWNDLCDEMERTGSLMSKAGSAFFLSPIT